MPPLPRLIQPGYQVALLVGALALVGVLGCGAAPVPVSGKVMLDNKPLTTGIVSFRPDKAKGNSNIVEPRGKIGDDGTYTLEINGKPGAPPGAYKVVVIAQGPPVNPKDPYSANKQIINPKYLQEEKTDLSVTVVKDPALNAYDLKVTK
jgi:hypothetical protein